MLGSPADPDYISAPGVLEPQKNLIKIKNRAARESVPAEVYFGSR